MKANFNLTTQASLTENTIFLVLCGLFACLSAPELVNKSPNKALLNSRLTFCQISCKQKLSFFPEPKL